MEDVCVQTKITNTHPYDRKNRSYLRIPWSVFVYVELYFYSLTHLNPQEVVDHQRNEGLKWVAVYLWFWKFPHICFKERTWRGKGGIAPHNIDKLKMEPKRSWRGPPFSCFNLEKISSRATTRASSITWWYINASLLFLYQIKTFEFLSV